jgi:hypothetical protein
MQCVECLDSLSGGGWGVFIALNHQTTVGVAASMGAPDTVRCASHVTQLLGSRAVDRWRLCLLVAPDSPVPHRTGTVQCPMSLWRAALTLRALFFTVALIFSFCRRPLREVAVAPLSHRTVRWIIAERAMRNPRIASLRLYGPSAPDTVRWHTGHCPVAHRTVRCARPGHTRFLCSFVFEPYLQSCIVCVESLCTYRTYNLEKTS